MFGFDAKVGLTITALALDVIHSLISEENLLSVITDKATSVEPSVVEPLAFEAPTVEPAAVAPPTVEPPAVDLLSVEPPLADPPAFEPSVVKFNFHMLNVLKRSYRILDSGKVGNNVTIPIPIEDRGRGNPKNIIEKNMDIDENDDYTIAVKSGKRIRKCTRNQLDLCTYELYSKKRSDNLCDYILLSAAQKESKSFGQSFSKCNCAGSKLCQTNSCKCFKLEVKCNSQCHSSLHCENKAMYELLGRIIFRQAILRFNSDN